MAVLKKFHLHIGIGFVERAGFREYFEIPADWPEGQVTVAQQVVAFSTASVFVEVWMRRNARDENCLLVVENNDGARKMMKEMHQWHQSDMAGMILDEFTKHLLPFRKIRMDPLFQEKQPSSALILADFCAYVWKKIVMDDDRYRRFYSVMKDQIIVFDDLEELAKKGVAARSV